MIGLKRGVVELKPYNPKWKDLFVQESDLISSAISEFLVDIQHIGSTAIPDIVSKPIIDVAVAIDSLDNIEKIITPLEKIGFIYRGEQGILDRILHSCYPILYNTCSTKILLHPNNICSWNGSSTSQYSIEHE